MPDNAAQVKQTYSAYVCDQQSRASSSPRKWHLSELTVILQAMVLIHQISANRKSYQSCTCLQLPISHVAVLLDSSLSTTFPTSTACKSPRTYINALERRSTSVPGAIVGRNQLKVSKTLVQPNLFSTLEAWSQNPCTFILIGVGPLKIVGIP